MHLPETAWRKIQRGWVTWRLSPEWPTTGDPEAPLSPESLPGTGHTRLGGRRGRATIRAHNFPAPGRDLVIKFFWVGKRIEYLKYLFTPTRAMQEWSHNLALRAAGVCTPAPVIYGEQRVLGVWRRSMLALESIDPLITLAQFIESNGSSDVRRRVIRDTADLVVRMHVGGFYHRDLHGYNILLRQDPLALRPVVIDLHRVHHYRRLSHGMRVDDVARLNSSIRTSARERLRFLYRYLSPEERKSWREWADEIDRRTRHIWALWARKNGEDISKY